ncbi:LssY C-terminal domain-containing protein [Vibrio sp. SCSIO 43136]|uniref:LssY C-terminal domain-containing protein n=1 Tax=Vibrio sp. SCSIO 43136 TaxID=2819101 RepID=UPI002075A9EC|nr:LssY C-terminal domain-containing protein [Vibrio sp. SCSIO 43136]USD67974.1 LssY C-terminal domain-containing protein [Vibrio sp. SCSIO 43136]
MSTWILFVGALLDALIGPNLLFPGEPFFLAAGVELFSGSWIAVVAVLAGGFLGDQISYFVGKYQGSRYLKRYAANRPKVRRAVARCRLLMRKRIHTVLVVSRLLGPVAWVMPFLAGTQKVPWLTFTLFSSVGLVLGIGQFIFWGYMGAAGVEYIPWLNPIQAYVSEHYLTMLAVMVSVGMSYYLFKQRKSLASVKSVSFLLFTLSLANYQNFFANADDNLLKVEPATPVHWSELELVAYPGYGQGYAAQAVNLIYVGESPRTLMLELGWIENKTFSRHDLDLLDYLSLIKAGTPPVSDLIWSGRPQDLAFQEKGTLLKRNHLRWWYAGLYQNTPVWVGAVSFDDGLAIKKHTGIVTVLHAIDPNVDRMRDKLKSQLFSVNVEHELIPLAQSMAVNESRDYYTDGRVLVINHSEQLKLANIW